MVMRRGLLPQFGGGRRRRRFTALGGVASGRWPVLSYRFAWLGGVSGGGQGAGVVPFQSFQGSESPVVRMLGVGSEAEVDSEAGFLLVELGFRDSEFGAAVVASHVAPEFAVDTPRGFQVPASVDEFLNEDPLMRVPRLVGFHEFRVQAVVFLLEIDFGGHIVLLPHSYHAGARKSVWFLRKCL